MSVSVRSWLVPAGAALLVAAAAGGALWFELQETKEDLSQAEGRGEALRDGLLRMVARRVEDVGHSLQASWIQEPRSRGWYEGLATQRRWLATAREALAVAAEPRDHPAGLEGASAALNGTRNGLRNLRTAWNARAVHPTDYAGTYEALGAALLDLADALRDKVRIEARARSVETAASPLTQMLPDRVEQVLRERTDLREARLVDVNGAARVRVDLSAAGNVTRWAEGGWLLEVCTVADTLDDGEVDRVRCTLLDGGRFYGERLADLGANVTTANLTAVDGGALVDAPDGAGPNATLRVVVHSPSGPGLHSLGVGPIRDVCLLTPGNGHVCRDPAGDVQECLYPRGSGCPSADS